MNSEYTAEHHSQIRRGVVISLCDRTGKMVEPWAEAGYECWCYDIQHGPGMRQDGLIRWIGCDLRYDVSIPAEVAIAFAFPPCTDLASSGARWWKGKGLRALSKAIELVARCADLCDSTGAPWMLENPIGALSTHWRKPDAMFDPCDYAGYLENPSEDAYTKKTCLWVGNGFITPAPKRVFPALGSKMHLIPPSADRANLRAVTPAGFARAVFIANTTPESGVWRMRSSRTRGKA